MNFFQSNILITDSSNFSTWANIPDDRPPQIHDNKKKKKK